MKTEKIIMFSILVLLYFIAKMVRADKESNPIIMFLSIKLLLPSAIYQINLVNTVIVSIAPCNYIKTILDVKTYISSF